MVALGRTLGVTAGHDETFFFVTDLIDRLEPSRSPAGAGSSKR